MLLDLLSRYATGEVLPPNLAEILRSPCALGLRESNLIGQITNVDELRPMYFDAKDM
jgi:hypothetical protein